MCFIAVWYSQREISASERLQPIDTSVSLGEETTSDEEDRSDERCKIDRLCFVVEDAKLCVGIVREYYNQVCLQ